MLAVASYGQKPDTTAKVLVVLANWMLCGSHLPDRDRPDCGYAPIMGFGNEERFSAFLEPRLHFMHHALGIQPWIW